MGSSLEYADETTIYPRHAGPRANCKPRGGGLYLIFLDFLPRRRYTENPRCTGYRVKPREVSILAADKKGEPRKYIAQNREARHEYFVIEALETGIELVGTEVKSLRNGGCNLNSRALRWTMAN